MDDVDQTVTWVRARGPQPLPLDGWNQASIWGWDDTICSLYAHLWRNTDDPAKPPAIRIEPGDYTLPIPFCATLAQHIAMATDSDPWRFLRPCTRSLIRTQVGVTNMGTAKRAKAAPPSP